jgi:hypothetical protein
MKCDANLASSTFGPVGCDGRQEGHKGMHHDWLKRVYWVLRTDSSVDYLKETPTGRSEDAL